MNFFVGFIFVFMTFTMVDQFVKAQKEVDKKSQVNMDLASDPLINKHPYLAD